MVNYNIPKLIVVAFIAINIWSCEEEVVDCEPFAIAVNDALTAYTMDRTEENCISYQAALQTGIDDGCDSNNVYQTQLSDLNCGCVGLDEAIVTASTNFIADPSTETCTAYKTALQSAVDGNCDPSGLYQEIINTLGDCSDPSSGIDCVNLISGVVTGNLTYSMDPTNETCNAYRDSLMAAILGGCDTDSTFQVSFDSVNPSLNDFYRGPDSWKRTMDGVKQLLQFGFQPKLGGTLTPAIEESEQEFMDFFSKQGFAKSDIFFRPLIQGGFSLEGKTLSRGNLLPEVCVDEEGVYWHPLSPNPDFLVTRKLFPFDCTIELFRKEMFQRKRNGIKSFSYQ